MLYYLMLVPAVLSTAVIYFLSPALSYWWLPPVLLGCFVAANLVYVLLIPPEKLAKIGRPMAPNKT